MMSHILRDNTSTPDYTRWEIIKSMLDDFPELQDRVEQYLVQKKNPVQPIQSACTDEGVKEMLQKAIRAYRSER